MHFRSISLLLATLLIGTSAFAHEYKAGNLVIGHPYARATVPGQPSGGAYMSIENTGKQADRLVGVASPVAKATEIHTMSMEGNVMRMREVSAVDIKPLEKVAMKPGDGYHIMLIGLSQPLKAGEKFPLTLTFEWAGKVDVSVVVEDKNKADKSGAAAKEETGHQHH